MNLRVKMLEYSVVEMVNFLQLCADGIVITLNLWTSIQKRTSFSKLSPLMDTYLRNCRAVMGLSRALRKAIMSLDDDIHLLSNIWNLHKKHQLLSFSNDRSLLEAYL